MTIGYDASRAFIKEKTGTETYSYRLLKAMLELSSSHSFRVYTRPDSFVVPEKVEDQRVPIDWQRLWTQGGLALETWKNSPDVLFIPAHVVPFLKNPRVPVVVTVHDLGLEYLPNYKNWKDKLYLGWIMERLRARLATHIIAVSEATKRDIIQKLGVPEGKVSVVYEGVDEKFQPKADRPLGKSDLPLAEKVEEISMVKNRYGIEGEYILFVGTVQPRKNLTRLIEAFSMIANNYESAATNDYKSICSKFDIHSLQLVIAGKLGWNYGEILVAPRKFGVDPPAGEAGDKVKFLNYVPADDLPALYAGARATCLPSLHEGFGLPVLESMAAGTPVVASNASSLPEVGGQVAEYVDPYDVNDIVRGIRRVLSWDNDERQHRIEQGEKWAAQFTWRRAAEETLGVLERAVA
ncbi:glycosyltransferase family 4 protein [Patescibacteria group bacterium]|nr:glycosyltransferase family 4 protein [Patescibacteria group bacterium]